MFSTEQGFTDALLKQRIVPITGEIVRNTAPRVISALTQLQLEDAEKPIKLVIVSGGGLTQAGLGIADYIAHGITAPVHAAVFGACSSSATFILAVCKERVCTPNSRFVVHMGTTGTELKHSDRSREELTLLLKDMATTDELMFAHYKRHLGLSDKQVKELCKRGEQVFDNELTAKEALAYGLITKVVNEPGESLGLF